MSKMLNLKRLSESQILTNLFISGEDNYLRLRRPVRSVAGSVIHRYVLIHGSDAMEDLHVVYEILVTSLDNRTEL